MLAVVHSYWVHGVEGQPVRVEVKVRSGLPVFTVVGLPAGAVREGKERVFAALAQTGMPLPPRRITVNLAPADLPKSGSGFDLPVTIALLVALEQIPKESINGAAFVGELGLDGSIRKVRGAIALAMACRASNMKRLFVPAGNSSEAAAVPGLTVLGASTLTELVAFLRGEADLRPIQQPDTAISDRVYPDLVDVRGQEMAKRALVIAAAGGHSLLMSGPPGAGKTMLAKRLPGLLPPLSESESLEVTRVHSVAGLLDPVNPVKTDRPFRAPHHTISAGGLIGGGNPPSPGEISLAHHGVLFLDELPEFGRRVLETLRQPIELNHVRIARVGNTVTFPARFQVVAAMNPCPCGLSDDDCSCNDRELSRYRARLSGPLLDRLDLRILVRSVSWEELQQPTSANGHAHTTASTRDQVILARERQSARFPSGPAINALLPSKEVMKVCRCTSTATTMLADGVNRFRLSARSVHRTLRVARTIADLAGEELLSERSVAESLQLRTGLGVSDPDLVSAEA